MPYLTIAEYRAAPTAVDTNNFILNDTQPAQDAALAQVIARASAWIDNTCNQPLIASLHVENKRPRYNRYGALSIHPDRTPLNQLVALSVGTNGANLYTVTDLTGAFIDEGNWIIPSSPAGAVSPISSFGSGMSGRGSQVLTRLTTVSGWPNTTLASAPAVGATSFTVVSPVGFTPALGSDVADMTVTIFDGVNTETITVLSVAGSTLNCAPLGFAHTSGVAVSGLPGDVKEAAILAVSGFIRARQSETLTLSNVLQAQGAQQPMDAPRSRALYDAKLMLNSYGRVR